MNTCQYPECESIKPERNGICATHNSLTRKMERQAVKDAAKKLQRTCKEDAKKKPKQKALAKHSEDVHYTTSDTGERVSRAEAEVRIRKTKSQLLGDMMYEHDYIFCQHIKEDGKICGMNCGYRDCSHNESVDNCIKNGKIEMSWWIGNFKVRCREHHANYDRNDLRWTVNNK